MLSTRPPFYSAVGVGTALFGRYSVRLSAVGIFCTYGYSRDNAAKAALL